MFTNNNFEISVMKPSGKFAYM